MAQNNNNNINNNPRLNNNNNNNNNNTPEHVEFSVQAGEDLYLEGALTTLRRVLSGTNYSCLMLKTQRFSSLFRHYAKYHGLRKDDLDYFFVDKLEPEDTPESIQLQRGDTIFVRKRRKPEPPQIAADDAEFFRDMQELLHDEEYKDAIFTFDYHQDDADDEEQDTTTWKMNQDDEDDVAAVLPPPKKKTKRKITSDIATVEEPLPPPHTVRIRAHKAILTARSPYFKALFRKQTFQPTAFIHVQPPIQPQHVRIMLEFLYTNRIATIEKLSTEDMLRIMHLADLWLLESLKKYMELEIIKPSSPHMTIETVGRLYAATQECGASTDRFQNACVEFILEHIRELADHPELHAVLKQHPTLYMPVLKRAAEIIDKKGLAVSGNTQQQHHHHHPHVPPATIPSSSLLVTESGTLTKTTAVKKQPTRATTHNNNPFYHPGPTANNNNNNNLRSSNPQPQPPPPANQNNLPNNNNNNLGSSPRVPDIL